MQGSFNNDLQSPDHKFCKSLLATCAWYLWKARCDVVFNSKSVSAHRIFHLALQYTKDYYWRTCGRTREVLHNSVGLNWISIFCDASWHPDFLFAGVGFAVVLGSDKIILAGASPVDADSSTKAELLALVVALIQTSQRGFFPDQIFTDCLAVLELLDRDAHQFNWNFQCELEQLTPLIKPSTLINYLPRELNSLADSLANFGRSNPGLSLFHQGIDRPRWLEELAAVSGLGF